jgi:hypothetical protein
MSIGKPPGPDADDNVYIVSMGPGGADHEPVFEHLRKQMERLERPRPVWHGLLQATVLVALRMLAKLADDPETRAKLAQTAGNLRGKSGNTAKMVECLAPCPACAPAVIGGHSVTACEQCAAWNYSHPVLVSDAPPGMPGGFPSQLRPAPIDFPYLMAVVKSVYTNVRNGTWTAAGAATVMQVVRVPERVRSTVLGIAAADGATNEWYPANWLSGLGPGGLPQLGHITEPMHLWFLGIVKAFMAVVYKWAASASKTPAVEKLWATRLNALRSIKWTVMRPFSATGGWVSENFVAWARILRWFFADLHLAVPSVAYQFPQKDGSAIPFHQFTKKNNIAFLRACGIDPSTYSSMGANELKEHMFQLRASDNPPSITTTDVSAVDVQVGLLLLKFAAVPSPLSLTTFLSVTSLSPVNQFPPESIHLRSQIAATLLHTTVARAMQPVATDESADALHLHVKAYLTAVDCIDAGHRGTNKPICVSKANHLSALNAAAAMKLMGPVGRVFWGGGHSGERAVVAARAATGSLQGCWSTKAVYNFFTDRVARRLRPRAAPTPRDHIKVVPTGAAALLAAEATHVQIVRLPGEGTFAIVVGRDREAGTVRLAPVAAVAGSVVVAPCAVAFWRWAPSGAEKVETAAARLQHWSLLRAHDGSDLWYACGDSWSEVRADGTVGIADAFGAVKAASATAAATAAAAASALSASMAAAETAAEEAAVAEEAVAASHAQHIANLLVQLYSDGIDQLTGVKCQALAQALFKVSAGTSTNRGARQAALRALLVTAGGATFVADRVELREGMKFQMEFAERSGEIFPGHIATVHGADMYSCNYEDGDEMEHSGDQLRIALQANPLHDLS